MSKQQVVEFFQTASKDEALAEKLKVSTSPSSILAIAAEYGYEFTEEELVQCEREQLEAFWNEDNELSDQQLEAVAGGAATDTVVPVPQSYICPSIHKGSPCHTRRCLTNGPK